MKPGNLIKCLDAEFTPAQIELIPNRPTKSTIYEARKLLHTRMGKAVLLTEIENPLLTAENGMKYEPSFNVKRFVIVDDTSGNNLREEIQEIQENSFAGV